MLEYEFLLENRQVFETKFLESIQHMTNKVGGIGKDVKAKHKEPKPIDRHNYCFLCKGELSVRSPFIFNNF